MAKTTSLAFPNMIDVSANKVAIVTDNASIVNRTALLLLTDPTELYFNPTFGVGLKRYLWQYNTENIRALMKDRIRDQLALNEPRVDAEATSFADGLLISGTDTNRLTSVVDNANRVEITVGLVTTYGDELKVELNDKYVTASNVIYANSWYSKVQGSI